MPRRTCVVLTGGASNCARRTARTSINPTYSSNPRAVPPHQWLPILVASAPPPPAPPCTVANLKARTAGDKGWPIACANVVIGDKTQDLDLNSASLSYGDFEGATFNGKEKIDLQGAGLENANLLVVEVESGECCSRAAAGVRREGERRALGLGVGSGLGLG